MTEVPDEKIIKYCQDVISRIKVEHLNESNVLKNEFLEYLFIKCQTQFEEEGKYELTDENISLLFSFKKQNEFYLDKIKNRELAVLGVDEIDNLIIDKNSLTEELIKENENKNR